MEISKKNTKKF